MNEQMPPPPPTAEIIEPTFKNAALFAAGQLGLFALLDAGPRSIPEIAEALSASETGVTLLVEALAGVGHLERSGDRFANGPTVRAWFTPSSPVDFTPLLLWAPVGLHLAEGLAQVIRDGSPKLPLYEYLQGHPEMGRVMSQYQKANAQLGVGPLSQLVPIPPRARRLLDLGGSHGLYSIAFCKRHPGLEAVVFDMPVALTDTERAAAAEGLADRVTVQHGDYLVDDIGEGYDVVLCFFLPHNHSEDDNKRLMAKAARALNPGGMIVIHEMLRGDPPNAFNALYSLIFFLYSGTRNYSYQEITGWMGDVGFGDFSRIDVPPTGNTSLVIAIKGAAG